MRLPRPARTLPGPHSAMRVTPRSASACTQPVHCTGRYNWRTSASRIDWIPSCTSASTFWTTGSFGSCQRSAAMVSDNRLAASRISGVCEGTLTASFTALRTPRSASSASARSTAAACPPITTCPGELKLAGTTTSSPDASRHASITVASSAPSTAAIAPVPAGAASCISCPRLRTRRAPSCRDSAPAATSAAYSPRLWPASNAGDGPPSCCHTRQQATPAASNAGWVNSVRLRVSSWPSRDSAHRSTPAPADASANASPTTGWAAASSASMPGNCDPCPGKTKASEVVMGWRRTTGRA